MNSHFAHCLAVFLLLIFSPVIKAEEKFFALVIGNSVYDEVGALRNPSRDADLIGAQLQKLGFQVTKRKDLDLRSMEESISQFARSLPSGSMAFFFYAGHGITINKHNYLIPTDAVLKDAASVKYRTVALDYVIDVLGASDSSLNVHVLDCCRNNPFERSWGNRSAASSANYLSIEAVPEGSIVAYSTWENSKAADGSGFNSPYSRALADSLASWSTEGFAFKDVFFRAASSVKQQTGQRPALEIDPAMKDFYFSGNSPTINTTATSNLVSPPEKSGVATPTPYAPSGLPQGATALEQTIIAEAERAKSRGELDAAIGLLSGLLNEQSATPTIRAIGFDLRSKCYLEKKNFAKALEDRKSAGYKSMQLTVLSDSNLKVGTTISGRLRKGQFVEVSHVDTEHADGPWLWVDSINGNTSTRGFTKPVAFEAPPVVASVPSTPPPRTSYPGTPSNSNNWNGSYAQRPNNSRPQPTSPNRGADDGSSGLPAGADAFTKRFYEKRGRLPTPLETPRWESLSEIKQLRAQGLLGGGKKK